MNRFFQYIHELEEVLDMAVGALRISDLGAAHLDSSPFCLTVLSSVKLNVTECVGSIRSVSFLPSEMR